MYNKNHESSKVAYTLILCTRKRIFKSCFYHLSSTPREPTLHFMSDYTNTCIYNSPLAVTLISEGTKLTANKENTFQSLATKINKLTNFKAELFYYVVMKFT